MKVITCGGRDYTLSASDMHRLHTLHAQWHFSLVLSGAAAGADAGGEAWAATAGVVEILCNAHYKKGGFQSSSDRSSS